LISEIFISRLFAGASYNRINIFDQVKFLKRNTGMEARMDNQVIIIKFKTKPNVEEIL